MTGRWPLAVAAAGVIAARAARRPVQDAALRCLQVGRLLPPELRVALAVLWPLRTLRVVTLPAPEVAVHDDWMDMLDVAERGVDEDDGVDG